jgi:hypothetical protein
MTPTREKLPDWPLWWFSTLEAAVAAGDRRKATEALRRLERLGYEVRFRLPLLPPREEEAPGAR